MTNAETIRSMTDKELAIWLCETIEPECIVCPAYNLSDGGWCDDGHAVMLEWLRSEVDEHTD